VAPAYAWYWNPTGDDTYRQRGDLLFEHAIDDSADGFWSGKEFSQNYKASFDYVHHRSSAKPVLSLTDPRNNPRDTACDSLHLSRRNLFFAGSWERSKTHLGGAETGS
jgi:hypothetical protein